MGVVKTINTMLRPTHQIFICEMGARNVGDISELCELVHPDYGVVTSVGPQHLESFKTMENIQKTKFELPDAVFEKHGAEDNIFLNYDSEYISSYNRYKGAVTYSISGRGKYNASDIRTGRNGTEFTLTAPDGTVQKYGMRLIGEHNVQNVVAAIAVSHTMGISLDELVIPVRRLAPVEHRMKLMEQGEMTIIDDAYNSNPVGSSMALDVLKMMPGKHIVVTPGMIELGDKEDEENFEFGKHMAKCADEVILVGKKKTKPIYDGLIDGGFDSKKIHVINDVMKAFDMIQELKENDTFVLLENDLPDIFNEK
jgi:UDP-N-acetylmuramoyl-tripeptide--D-alanyl-D-alanine ligase